MVIVMGKVLAGCNVWKWNVGCLCSERMKVYVFFFQAEDGIRDLVRSRGLGDVYKRQCLPLILK